MIDLFFTVLNFMIFIAIAYYAVQRYLLPAFKSKIEQARVTEQSLHDEHRTLLTTQRQIDESIVSQETDCTNYLAKINQWRSAVHTHKAQQEAEERHWQEQAEKRLHLQSQYHMLKAMHERITPFVVKALEEDMKTYFADEHAAQTYLQNVLKTLKK